MLGHTFFPLLENALSRDFPSLSVCICLTVILSCFCWGPKPLLPPCGHSEDVLLWVHRFVCAVRAHHNLDIISEVKYQAVYVCSAPFSFTETQFTLRPTQHTHTHTSTHTCSRPGDTHLCAEGLVSSPRGRYLSLEFP